jgi:NAD(P)-dependent dehydrogenase (short-subunit alcohol dehydrogenase family)
MTDRFDLTGKVALITGGSRGLGREIAEGLAEAGATTIITARREQWLGPTEAEMRAAGLAVTARPCDVTDEAAVEALVAGIVDEHGALDIVVNNAGMSPLYPSLDAVTEDAFDKVIGVNFKGPFRLTALVGKRMHEGAGGSVINMSSIAGVEASPYALPYAGAKAALNSLTAGFAAAYSPNVRVNSIIVGPFATDVSDHWADPRDPANPGYTRAGMRVGRPDEIVGAALYLASDASSFTNGALLRVDGGPVRARRAAP